MPISPEIKKYLGVLPVPRPKSRFSKIDFFMNFCNFFLIINLAEIFFLESLGQMPKTLKTEFWNSNRKCQKKIRQKVEKIEKIDIWKIDGKSLRLAKYNLWHANQATHSLPGRRTKYLGVLPVPRVKPHFSKIDFYRNFLYFFPYN